MGKMLSKLARFSGFKVTVVDDRHEFANRENIPDADDLAVRDFERSFDNLPIGKDSYIVIATRGHNHDLDAVKAALRTEAGYVGLLGSRRKKALLHQALKASGFHEADIARVIIPVGIDIGSVTPEEIAVSIMAQIIQRRRDHGASGVGRSSCSGLFNENEATKTSPSAG